MPPFIYRCPNTGYLVQGFIAKDATDASEGDETYEPVTCLMCQQLHLVNPKTGAVLGDGDE